ncbi:HlyD family secretion protein [Paracoccus halophilus]|uniref:Hemolysin secretion protein D n=1 Tax=Paracoccus halophilus TaxID=376733 RepID=A0A099F4M3_9RHOB|nr:HlyD family efflux transporter periplasmic adaptor subunit [Paracoccus halophilus]KGJ05374.1 hemolysin secretion protein D [Paracoccus halophilus]SFA48928.1 HlyD family secretion protein [Paracoccus halophilus]
MIGFICAMPLISALFGACGAPPPFATGYVEGEYVLISPLVSAQLMDLPVARGDRVAAGQVVAVMETRDAEIAVAQARGALAQAENQLANLQEGSRPEEIRVLEAALASARAQAAEAEKEVARQESLRSRNVTSQAQLDEARTSVEVARARVAQAEAELAVARLPARPQEIRAARAGVEQSMAALEAASWQLDRRSLTVPAPGVVFDLIRRPGELAGPSAPVLSYLPDGAVRLRLYVPQAEIARVKVGDRLRVNCDGCRDGAATVTYVSDKAEFTPPVIYSLQNRQKLVYLIEARPDDGEALKPGQIVDVALSP